MTCSNCPICWEEMDMKEFKDSKDSTETCFKLECGHSYHTKCIVQFLTKTTSACPICNKIKNPEMELDMQGFALKLLNKILHTSSVRTIRKEFNESMTEYKTAIQQLKQDTASFIGKRQEELRLQEKRDYVFKCFSVIKQEIRSQCLKRGNKYVGAYLFKKHRWEGSIVEHILLPKKIYGWRMYRLIHPRLFFPIKFNKKVNNELNELNDIPSDGNDNNDLHPLL